MMMIFIGGLCSSSLSISWFVVCDSEQLLVARIYYPQSLSESCLSIHSIKYTNIIYRFLFANRCYCFVSLHWINSWLMHVPRSVFGRRHNLHCRICKLCGQPKYDDKQHCWLPKSYKCSLPLGHSNARSIHFLLELQWDNNNNKYTLARWAERGSLFLCTANIFAQSQCWIEWMRDHHQGPRIGGRTALANEMHLVAGQGTGMCLF